LECLTEAGINFTHFRTLVGQSRKFTLRPSLMELSIRFAHVDDYSRCRPTESIKSEANTRAT